MTMVHPSWYFESKSFCGTGAFRAAIENAQREFEAYLETWDEVLEDNERIEIVSTSTNFTGDAERGSFVITVVVKKITLCEPEEVQE